MKRKLAWLMAGLLSASAVSSQAQSTHTLLWQVSGKNLTRPSYLFGTMHVLCADDAALSDSLKAVIAACDKVYFEINLGDMSGMLAGLRYMQMNDNKKLSDLLEPAAYSKVKAYFNQHVPMPPFSMLERFKPMLISGIIEEQGLGCPTTDGMEMMIMKEARPLGKPVDGLETVEFQARLFDSIPYEDQAKELVNDIDSIESNRKMTRNLAELYKKQDLEKIDELSRQEDQGMSKYMNILLYDRNRKWARMLDGLMQGNSLLIAVGAAHLPGENGVIDLLRKEGYTVRPVKN